MSKHGGRLRRWKSLFTGGDFAGQRPPRLEAAERAEAAGERAGALTEVIAAHERLLGHLVAATVAEQAVLRELYQSAGVEQRKGTLSPAPSAPAPSAAPAGQPDRCAEVRADLDARLFGPFDVRYKGQAMAPWPSQRAASLLKFLLLHQERAVRREVLMDAFWPGSSPKSARNNLNVTVYQLRQQLRAHDPCRTHIVYNAGSYRIDPELRCRTDVDEYARAVARGHQAADGDRFAAINWYREARRLYAGPLLEDDTSGDWYIGTQHRLHFEHCGVLERLCGLLLDSGEIDEAVTVGDDLLRTDPCRETGHQLLMRAYAALDQPQLIVQQFRRCETTMRRELSVGLSEATVELYRELLNGR